MPSEVFVNNTRVMTIHFSLPFDIAVDEWDKCLFLYGIPCTHYVISLTYFISLIFRKVTIGLFQLSWRSYDTLSPTVTLSEVKLCCPQISILLLGILRNLNLVSGQG